MSNFNTNGRLTVYDQQVVEQGSNANGEYTKYYDGTLICRGRFSGSGTPTVSLPYPFINTDYYVLVGCEETSSAQMTARGLSAISRTVSTFTRGATSGSYDQNYLAIGRWK